MARSRFLVLLGGLTIGLLMLSVTLLSMPLAMAASSTIVISQFQTGGNTSADDEFIELHNIGATPFDLSGYRLVYRASGGTSDVNLAAWGTSTMIPAGGFYLIARPQYDGSVTADVTYNSASIGAGGGGLAIRQGALNSGTIIDSVGYGTAPTVFVETAVTGAPSSNNSSARINNGCTDTDNNSADFALLTPSAPRNSASAVQPCGSAPAVTPTTTATGTPTDPCAGSFTPIYEAQGSGAASPLVNQTITTEGVVTGDFQGNGGLNGFAIQDESGDGNALTSDGIFVFVPAGNPLASINVQIGDLVRLTGRVVEFNQLTEIDNVTALTVCSQGNPALATIVDLPEQTNGDLERFEGMLVTFPEPLTVDQNYFQGRYGQVTLSSDGRLYQPTNFIDAQNQAAVQQQADQNQRRLLVLDDANSSQNPNPLPYIGPDNTLRAGDVAINITGVLDYGPINSDTSIRDYRLQPTLPVTFTRANPRTAAPDPVGGDLRVASFNVLNYFTTIDQTGAACFPSNTRSDCRGADSTAEFQRQSAKIVAALTAINADVVGLIEIENNGATAVNDLVGKLNAATAPGTYAAVADPAGGLGDDAIKVAMIYKPARVVPVGAARTDADPIYDRLPLAQTFRVIATNEVFTPIVNHFKSKGSCPSSSTDPNADQGDGQGCWNARRVQQAQALLDFVGTLQQASGDPDVLVIGDLNSYGEEDPIDTLRDGGFVDQIQRFIGSMAYSYVFDGQAGYLDHALASSSLSGQVSGVTQWHINADEPSVIDYNTEFKPQDLYATTPYRSSDHDPVVIGLGLTSDPLPIKAYLPLTIR